MAGGLKTLFETMQKSEVLLAVPGLTQLFGEENIEAAGDAPRVVWVPVDSVYEGPSVQERQISPRVIYSRREQIEAHVWAADPSPSATEVDHADACEILVNAVVAALQIQQWTGYYWRAVRGFWKQAGVVRRGRAYVLLITQYIPVTMPRDQTVVVTGMTLTPTIEHPTE